MSRFAPETIPPRRCSFGAYLDDLPDVDRDDLEARMMKLDARGQRVWSVRALVDLIVAAGDQPFDRGTISKHRSGSCRCHPAS